MLQEPILNTEPQDDDLSWTKTLWSLVEDPRSRLSWSRVVKEAEELWSLSSSGSGREQVFYRGGRQ